MMRSRQNKLFLEEKLVDDLNDEPLEKPIFQLELRALKPSIFHDILLLYKSCSDDLIEANKLFLWNLKFEELNIDFVLIVFSYIVP